MTESMAGGRVQWIQEGGKEILFVTLKDNVLPEASLAVLGALEQCLEGKPPHSVLVLVDTTNASYEPSVGSHWRTAYRAHAPVMRGCVFYGHSGMMALSLTGFVEMLQMFGQAPSGDELKLCKTREEGVAWLLQR